MTNQFRLAAAMVILFAQTPKLPPEAYPGQRDHKEPPKGWTCSPLAKDKAHRCQCKRMALFTEEQVKENTCCEEVPRVQAAEDSKCAVWCHKDHCDCPITCAAGGHQH